MKNQFFIKSSKNTKRYTIAFYDGIQQGAQDTITQQKREKVSEKNVHKKVIVDSDQKEERKECRKLKRLCNNFIKKLNMEHIKWF